MRRFLFCFSLLLCVCLAPVSAFAADDERPHTVRLFLNDGERLDFSSAEVDSITMTPEAHCIWMAGTCTRIAIERIDSIWYITPTLRLSTASLDFGTVAVGNAKTVAVTLTNTGDYPETYIVLADGVFSASQSAMESTVNAGMSHGIELSFAPGEVKSYSSAMILLSSAFDGGQLRLPLTGEGIDPDSLDADVVLPPDEFDFDVVLDEGVALNDLSGFKIVNAYGEFPVHLPPNAAAVRKVRRAAGNFNMFTTPGMTSPNGVQFHALTDGQDNPYLFTFSLPGERPEMSVRETAISLLMMCPMLFTSDEAEYRNTVALIESLDEFDNFVAQVAQIYYDAQKRKICPDYSSVNVLPVVNALYNLVKDSHDMTFSGVSLANLSVTPVAASFRVHNDFRRSLTFYPSRVKMGENNLVVTEREDATPKLFDQIDEMLNTYRDAINGAGEDATAILSYFDQEDIEFYEDLKDWVQEIERQLSSDPDLAGIVNMRVPYTLNAASADYFDIVAGSLWGERQSVFEKESEWINVEFKDYDKIFLDVYGLGNPGSVKWKSLSPMERFNLITSLMVMAYNDVVQPLCDVITGYKKAKNASIESPASTFNFDFRYGARKWPEVALVMKLGSAFLSNSSNVTQLASNIDKGDIKAISWQIVKFVWKEMTKLPGENPDDKRTYLNLIYNIGKKYAGKSATSVAFRQMLKDNTNRFLQEYNFIMRSIDVAESGVDFFGSVQAWYDSKIMETFVIDRYAEPYIHVIKPESRLNDINQTVHFEWETFKASTYGSLYSYDLELTVESPTQLTHTRVLTNMSATSCDYDMSQLSRPGDTKRVLFRIIAHHPENSNVVYAQTDYITLYDRFAAHIPVFYDLGLPSGTLWSSVNLGATQSTDYGNYYAWGELSGYDEGKMTFSWGNYAHAKGAPNMLTKYCTKAVYGNNGFTDGRTQLLPSDDLPCQLYGYHYAIPTKADWEELVQHCRWVMMDNGTAYVRGPNGNVIFLPMAGYRQGESRHDAGKAGYYWSSTLDANSPDDAWFVYFGYMGKPSQMDYYRSCGRSIRPVMRRVDTSVVPHAPQPAGPDDGQSVECVGEGGLTVKTVCRSAAK